MAVALVQVINERLVPVKSIFRVRLTPRTRLRQSVMAGKVVLQSEHRSFLQRAWQWLVVMWGGGRVVTSLAAGLA